VKRARVDFTSARSRAPVRVKVERAPDREVPVAAPLPDRARAYAAPQRLPRVSDHKTFEMQTVRLADDIDPRRMPTQPSLARVVGGLAGGMSGREHGRMPSDRPVTLRSPDAGRPSGASAAGARARQSGLAPWGGLAVVIAIATACVLYLAHARALDPPVLLTHSRAATLAPRLAAGGAGLLAADAEQLVRPASIRPDGAVRAPSPQLLVAAARATTSALANSLVRDIQLLTSTPEPVSSALVPAPVEAPPALPSVDWPQPRFEPGEPRSDASPRPSASPPRRPRSFF
jgi:hypothetical protein